MSGRDITTIVFVGRWEPDAKGRLYRAALDLFAEHGFERTTVAGIAERAGVTERTFFRHFVDKREVLFSGQGPLHDVLVESVATSAPDTAPRRLVAEALDALATLFPPERRDVARRRQAVIDADTHLQERELLKLATLGAAYAESLQQRGLNAAPADVVAECTITVFKVAFARWITDGEERPLAEIQRQALVDLAGVTAAAAP